MLLLLVLLLITRGTQKRFNKIRDDLRGFGPERAVEE
jgi:hypothetical protein